MLLRAIRDKKNEISRDLFHDCINGIIQAETYLLEERGFPSTRAYEEFWNKAQPRACRYRTHLARATYTWYEYLGHSQRQGNLFNRYKNCAVYRKNDGDMVVRGGFSDSFHDLGISVLVQKDGLITDIESNFIRTRDPICVEIEQLAATLAGKLVTKMDKRDIRAMLGGADGCLHLVDITDEVRKAATIALERTDRLSSLPSA